MNQPCASKTLWIRLALVIVIGASFLFPFQTVHANSLPPPSVVWLEFEFETEPAPRLQGIQLVGCESGACAQPILLQQSGECDEAGCIAPPETLTGMSNSIGCADDICRSSAFPSHGGSSFRIVAQFSDRLRTSAVVEGLPAEYGEESTWRVLVGGADLSLERQADAPVISHPHRLVQRNLGWVGLSILIELLVAGLCFRIFAQTELTQLPKQLLMVLLVNLISLPVAWIFIPSLGQFQQEYSRSFGSYVLVTAGVFAALLAFIYRSEGKSRWRLVALTIALSLLTAFCYLSLLPWLLYGGVYTVHVQGLSANAVIIVAELFALVFEAVMISILSRKTLSPRLIWLVSFLMNTASFVVGLGSRSFML